jgi:hypothetical protein
MFAECASAGRFQRQHADVNPRLEMTGAGLQHDAWLMTIGSHRFENRWRSLIQIEQNVAGVLVSGVRPEVDITALAVANTQKPDCGRVQQKSTVVLRGMAFWWRGGSNGSETDREA